MRSGLKSHSYQEPNLKETVSREEEWGNLACVRAAWVQLGEGHVHRERLNRAISGPAPLFPHSHTIMHHPRPSLSSLIHLSPPQQGPVVQSPIKTSQFMVSCFTLTDWRREVGGSLRLSHQRGLQKKMAASVVVPWFLQCAFVVRAGACSGCRWMRDEGVNCV